jgi:hypothetical protein
VNDLSDTPDAAELDDLRRQVRESEAARHWWSEHRAEMLRLYPDQFVAMLDGRVVAAASELLELISKVESQSLRMRDVKTKYIETDPARLIL